MPLMFRPRPQKQLAIKVGAIFLCQAIAATLILVAASHGAWRWQTWGMLNQHRLKWNVSLLSVSTSALCDAPAEQEAFHYSCLAVFKNPGGSLGKVRDFICGLRTVDFKPAPEFSSAIQAYFSSCPQINRVASSSLACFILLVFAGVFVLISFATLLAFSYHRFERKSQAWVYASFGTQMLSVLLVTTVVLVYRFTASVDIPDLFNYVNHEDPTQSPISLQGGEGWLCWGYWMAVAMALFTALIALFEALWIPIVPVGGMGDYKEASGLERVPLVQGKKSNTKKVKPKVGVNENQRLQPDDVDRAYLSGGSGDNRHNTGPTRETFWAYMPQVFQPEAYVTDYTHTPEYTITTTQTVIEEEGRPPRYI